MPFTLHGSPEQASSPTFSEPGQPALSGVMLGEAWVFVLGSCLRLQPVALARLSSMDTNPSGCTQVHAHTCTPTHIHTYTCTSCTHACPHVYTHIHTSIPHIHACTHTTHTHTHIWLAWLSNTSQKKPTQGQTHILGGDPAFRWPWLSQTATRTWWRTRTPSYLWGTFV